MKPIHFFLLIALLSVAGTDLLAQCSSFSGTINTNPVMVCAGSDLVVATPTDAVLDTNDILIFVAYTGTVANAGSVFASNASGIFPINGAFIANSPFHVAAIVGNDDSSGGPDWSDPCLSISSGQPVTVSAPIAEAGPEFTLNCVTTSVILNGSGSSVGPEYAYAWSTVGGSITGAANTLNPIVDEPGQYCLLVTNVLTGCTASDCTTVVEDITPPTINFGPAPVLNCVTTTGTLTIAADPPNVTFAWFGPSGWTSTLNNPMVSIPGTYCVVVTTINGCTATDCLPVIQDLSGVPVTITPPPTISCNNPVVTLEASTPIGGQYTYNWSTTNGIILSGGTTLHPVIASPGIYCITVTNTSNGCTGTNCVTVLADNNIPICQVYTPPVISCGNQAVVIDGSQSSSGPNYVYQWNAFSGGHIVSGELTNKLTVDAPGLYGLTVIDTVSGCQATITVPVVTDGTIPIASVNGPGNIVTIPCNSTQSLPVNCTISGGQAPYSIFTWSGDLINSPNGAFQLAPLAPGVYVVTIADAAGCTSVMAPGITVVLPSALNLTVMQNPTPCGPTLVSVSVSGGQPPYSYIWDSGIIVQEITATQAGVYDVTVSDAAGCTAIASDFVDANPYNCGKIKGFVFMDLDGDCAYSAEPPVGGFSAIAIGASDTLYATVGSDGFFEIPGPPGNYQVSFSADPDIFHGCFAAYPVAILGLGDSFYFEAPMEVLTYCPVMQVDIGTPFLRRCFSNYYYVHYCNMGSTAAINARVEVKLDTFLTPLAAEIPYVSLPGNLLQFDLGTVDVGQCGDFWIETMLDCTVAPGMTHCTEAHIFPDSSCSANLLWSGASVQLDAHCDGDSVRFYLHNVGTAPMTESLDYVVIEDGVMFMTQAIDPLDPNELVSIAFPANGSTWRLETNQEPNHPGYATPSATVEGCTVTGTFSTGYFGQFALNDADAWLDIDCKANVGSYDPNDKQGFPRGYGAEQKILPNTDIEYAIRFQNTGTDTAFTVVIRDTLLSLLDPASVRPGPSSHAYAFEVYGEGIIKFTFNQIMLPDSNVNEPASHGFVKYTVSQKPTIAVPSDIYNSAGIYFDFNEPVITNQTHHKVDTAFIAILAVNEAPNPFTVQITPNPFYSEAVIALLGQSVWQAPATLTVFDMFGSELFTTRSEDGRFKVKRNQMPEGVYFFKISASNGVLAAGKLMVNK